MLVTTFGIGCTDHAGRVVSLQLHRTRGARFHVSGVPWAEVRNSLARIYAAFDTCGFARPTGAFTIHVSPVNACRHVQSLDVPLALAMLSSMGELPPSALANSVFAGELGLDGSIHLWSSSPLSSLNLSKVQSPSWTQGFVPQGGASSLYRAYSSLPLRRIDHLTPLVRHLKGIEVLPYIKVQNPWNHREKWAPMESPVFQQLQLSTQQWLALTVAAAGRLSLLLVGSPGTGKSQMARAVWELLPKLTEDQNLELQSLHGSRGELRKSSEIPPFRTPHHSSSAAGLTGTKSEKKWCPGELSLARFGVLCLDELNEFSRDCIESLRGPMERNRIDVVRSGGSVSYPVETLIIGTANPCPCGNLHEGGDVCICSPHEIKRYLMRISGPVADRFSLHIETTQFESTSDEQPSLETLRNCIQHVRKRVEASLPFEWTEEALVHLDHHAKKMSTSHRGKAQLRKIAEVHALVQRVLAFDQKACALSCRVTEKDVEFAGQLRIFDRPRWWEQQAPFQPEQKFIDTP